MVVVTNKEEEEEEEDNIKDKDKDKKLVKVDIVPQHFQCQGIEQ